VDQPKIKDIQAHIELATLFAAGSSTLRLFGYQRVDRRTAAALGSVFNQKLFQVLVGSHAFGALLNELGGIAPAYATPISTLRAATSLRFALPADTLLRCSCCCNVDLLTGSAGLR
jgi:hypothetical protein